MWKTAISAKRENNNFLDFKAHCLSSNYNPLSHFATHRELLFIPTTVCTTEIHPKQFLTPKELKNEYAYNSITRNQSNTLENNYSSKNDIQLTCDFSASISSLSFLFGCSRIDFWYCSKTFFSFLENTKVDIISWVHFMSLLWWRVTKRMHTWGCILCWIN